MNLCKCLPQSTHSKYLKFLRVKYINRERSRWGGTSKRVRSRFWNIWGFCNYIVWQRFRDFNVYFLRKTFRHEFWCNVSILAMAIEHSDNWGVRKTTESVNSAKRVLIRVLRMTTMSITSPCPVSSYIDWIGTLNMMQFRLGLHPW